MQRSSHPSKIHTSTARGRKVPRLLGTFTHKIMRLRHLFTRQRVKRGWYTLISLLTLLAVLVGYYPQRGLTQTGGAFVCDRSLYISQGQGTTQLNRVNTNPFGLDLIGQEPNVEYNAIGFNVQDGFIYGISPQGSPPIVYRIFSDGTTDPLGTPTGFPNIVDPRFAFAGDIDGNGIYYVYVTVNGPAPADQPNFFAINLATNTVVSSQTLVGTNFADISFNPVDGQLYAFDTTLRQMAQINPTTGAVTYFGAQNPPGIRTDTAVGASFFDAFGNFFAYESNGPQGVGNVLVIPNLSPANPVEFQTQASNVGGVLRFDGASCAFAVNLEKAVAPQTVTAGGTVTYTYRVPNQRSEPLTVTFRDELPADGRTYVAGTLTNTFGGTPNEFGGTRTLTITNLTIPPRSIATFSVQARIPLDIPPGELINQATVIPPNGQPVLSDSRIEGLFPAPTPVQVTPAPPTPRIGLAKRVASVVNVSEGNFQVTYELVVSNFGNVDLTNIQITENLAATYGTTPFTVNSVSSPTGNLTPNPNYNGRDNINLLAGTDTLPIGESRTIQLVITVTPGGNLGPYNNQAQATGQSTAGPVSDQSQNGSDPDSTPNGPPANNGDGDPTNNNEPTPVSFNINPALGVAKEVVSAVPQANGDLTVTYRIRAQNFGDATLTNLQLEENLTTTFGTTPFTVNQVISPNGNLTPNPNYNGRDNINLLAGTDTLGVNETKILDLVVTITPDPTRQRYENQVVGTAQSPIGPVTDRSQNGIRPDPNNDNNPTNDNDPTPVLVGPNLRLVKRITNVFRSGVPITDVDFASFVEDPTSNDDDASGWAQLPGGILAGQINIAPPLQTGDEVEYTVYYLSDGTQPISEARFCDPIPARTTFIPNTFGSGLGILFNQGGTSTPQTNALDTDRGTFFSPLSPVTSPCSDLNNPNGSVFVEAGTISNAPPDNVGFVRFRVRIN